MWLGVFKPVLQRYKELKDIIAILGMDELSEEDKLTFRGRERSNASCHSRFHVAEVFTGSPGIYVSLKDTIAGFKGILAGEYDHLPEQAFTWSARLSRRWRKRPSCRAEGTELWRRPCSVTLSAPRPRFTRGW